MSDEQRKDEETEVEGHGLKVGANDEPSGDEVEGHAMKVGANDEPRDEMDADDEVEGHLKKTW
jgi:hypothetical protein